MRIQLDRLSKRYGRQSALEEVSLTIEPGQIVAVVGTNGAGKSTLLRLLAAILAPSSGAILLDGQRLDRGRLDLRRRLALLPDLSPVPAGATPIDYIDLVVSAYSARRRGLTELAVGLLDDLDLLPLIDTPAANMSRGQAYKVALAGMLAVSPDLWLCDEPFASGMDPQGLAVYRNHAQKTAGRGGTVLYTTQIVELAEQFSDRVLILDGGRLHACQPVENLRDRALWPGDAVLGRIFAGLHSAAR
jgi:ABC-type multidrug transport system ATPase subunit